jgi:ABC-2 type transport system permease protein
MFMLFIFLLTTYSLGTEIKFDRHKEWLATADNNIFKAVYGKLLPQTLTFSLIMFVSMSYMFGILHFPAPGGEWRLMLLALLGVLGAQGFAVFLYGLIPSLRMSMRVCSLLAVLSFSMVGVAFPVYAMDSPLQAIAWIFPMRHYYLIYQLCVFNNYPLSDAISHILMLVLFALMPLLVMRRMRRAVNEFGYQP